MTISNSPHNDNAMKLAGTVGANVRTLRGNKRALAQSLVLAVASEGFKVRDAWDAARKAAKFASMEKPEQNGFSTMLSQCKTIIEAWDELKTQTITLTIDKAVVAMTKAKAFEDGHIVYSTLAKDISDADKAKLKLEAEEAAKEAASNAASLLATQDIEGDAKPEVETPTPAPMPSAIVSASAVMVEALSLPLDHKFEDADADAIKAMVAAVDDFKARVIELMAKAA